jgi:hypothetical protein
MKKASRTGFFDLYFLLTGSLFFLKLNELIELFNRYAFTENPFFAVQNITRWS